MQEIDKINAAIDKAVDIELSRRNFYFFCLYYDAVFFGKRPFLKKVAEAFQKVYDGEIKSLSISLPPRAGKSYITSLFAAWMLGKKPTESVMRNTCTATLYEKFSYDTRNIVRNQKFKDVFPDVELASDKQNLTGWNLKQSKQVGYFGAGVGGTIIGFGASAVAITDDLYKDISAALSGTMSNSIKQWKQSAHDSRLEKNCPIIDIGTRWSKTDVIGENMEAGNYDLSIVISALDINDKSFCEDVKTTEEYLSIRQSLINKNSNEIWLAEYQQEPAEIQGLLFRPSDIKRFKMDEFTAEWENIQSRLAYIDPAEGGGDALAAIYGQIVHGKVFITDVIYSLDTVEVTEPRAAEIFNRLDFDAIKIEKNGNGSGFVRDMRKLIREDKVFTVTNSVNKGIRIWNEYGFIQKHFYFLEESEYLQGSDYDKFMRNIFSYMKIGENQQDGAPDATAGLSKFIQANPNTAKLFV
jgi:hypothetical protein